MWGGGVLEIGAGIGNLSRCLAGRRELYVASDIDAEHLARLSTRLQHRPNFRAVVCDLSAKEDFVPLEGRFDSVICLNVLEHVEDDRAGLANIYAALEPGGRAIVLVPDGMEVYGELDRVLGHVRRYSRAELEEKARTAGFVVERTFGFNHVTRPGWWFNGRVLKRRRFSRFQLAVFDRLVWLWRRIDGWLPWPPTSIITVLRRPAGGRDGVNLRVHAWRYEFRAMDDIAFPPGMAANFFRGAFGLLFRQTVCDPHCPGAKACPKARDCAYARMFEPRQSEGGPSGLQDLPRPFVLRAAELDGRRFRAGERLAIDVHLFEKTAEAAGYFGRTFALLKRTGLGPRRARLELVTAVARPSLQLELGPAEGAEGRVKVRFLTPTELKSEGKVVEEPRFDVLFARARDRVTSLAQLYQGAAADVDFRALGEQAREVRMIDWQGEWSAAERKSTRTGQRHPLAGFTGVAVYEGRMGALLPYLKAAYWTGVGRQTVWGHGVIAVEPAGAGE